MTDTLAQLSAAGVSASGSTTSPASGIVSGGLAEADRRAARRRRHHQPDDLRQARWPRATTTTRRSRELAARGADVERGGLRDHHRRRAPAACDVFRPVYDATDGVDGRVSIEVDPRLAHDTAGTIAEAKQLWAKVDRPNVFIKIPATAGGPAGDHRGRSRAGISVNVTLIFCLERYREVINAYLAGLEKAKASGHRPVHDPLGRLVLRLPGRHRGRQAPRRDRHRRGAWRSRARPASPTRGWPTRSTRRSFASERGEAAAGGRRAHAAPAVGVDRREGPELPRHHVRRRTRRRRTWSTPCRRRPWTPSSTTARSAATPSPAAYAEANEVLDALAEPGHLLRRRRPRCSRSEGVEKFDGVLGRAAGHRRRRPWSRRRRWSADGELRHCGHAAPPPDAVRRHRAGSSSTTWSPRASPRQDPTLWGPDAEAEAAKRLGWIEAAAISAAAGRRDRRAARGSCTATGVDHVVLAGMGGSSLAPEVITRTAGVELTVLDSTDPGQVLRGAGRPARRPACSWSRRSPAPRSRPTASAGSTSRRSSDAGIDPVRRIVVVTDPGSPLDSRGPGGRLPRVQRRPERRRPLLRADRVRPGALRAGRRRHRRRCSTRPTSVAGSSPSTSADNPGLDPRRRHGRHRPLRDKLGLVDDGSGIVGLRRLGRAADRRVHRQAGHGHPAGRARHATPPNWPNGCPTCRSSAWWTSAARHRTASARARSRSAGRSARQILVWEYAIAVAGRLLGINPFDQPDVEAAKVATRGLLDARPEPAAPAFIDGAIEVRGSDDVAGRRRRPSAAALSSALLAELGDGRLPRRAGLRRPGRRTPTARELRDLLAAEAAGRSPSAGDRGSCTPPASSTRAAPPIGVFLQITDDRRRRPRRSRTGRSRFGATDPGAGRRRRQRARRARPAGAHAHLTDPAPSIAALIARCAARPSTRRPRTSQELDVTGGDHAGVQPAADALRPPAEPHRRAERARHLRRDRRPVPQEADAGGLRPGQPGAAAARASRWSGFARRDWADQDFAQVVHDAVKQYARTPFDEEVWAQLAARHPVRARASSTTTRRSSRLKRDARRARRASAAPMGNHAFYLSIPPKSFPQVHRAAAPLRPGRAARGPAGAGWSSRSRSAATWSRRGELNDVVESVFPPDSVFRIDHYLGKETVQNILALRFANQLYEPIWNAQLRRPRADHDGRGHRRRRPGRLLRRHRRGPRRHPEPPAAAAGADRDGGAGLVRRRRPARREGEGALAPCGCPQDLATGDRPRAVLQRLAGRREGRRLPRGGRHEPAARSPRPTPRSDSSIGTRRWAGGAVLPARRQAARPPGDRDRRGVQARAAATCSPRARPRRSGRTRSSSGCSPTRASPSGSAPRCRAPGCRCATSRWTSATATRSPRRAPRPTSDCILDVLLGDPPLFPRHDEVELSWKILDPIEEFWATQGQPEQYRPGHLGTQLRR